MKRKYIKNKNWVLNLQPSAFSLQHVALIAVFAAFCACASGESYLVSPNLRSAPVSKVAVLPFDNQSTDITAPDFMRKLSGEQFSKWGYAPVPFEDVDEILDTIGISDGGQLAAVKSAKLGALLGADLLCYGDVEDFTFQNLGFVVRKSVILRLKIISAGSGETLFEALGKGTDIKFHSDTAEAKKAFIEASARKLVENMLKLPLRKEAETAVGKVFDRMPRR